MTPKNDGNQIQACHYKLGDVWTDGCCGQDAMAQQAPQKPTEEQSKIVEEPTMLVPSQYKAVPDRASEVKL